VKITVVSHDSFWPLRGGGGLRVYWVVKKFFERGHDVSVVAPFIDKTGTEEEFPGLGVYDTGRFTRFCRHKELEYSKMALKMLGSLLKINGDLIYAHNAVAGFPSLIASKLKHIPLVFDMDDIQLGLSTKKIIADYGPQLEYFIARNASAVISMSESLGEELKRHGVPEVNIIPHGVDLKVFKPKDSEKKDLIIYTGGVEPHDGALLIPEAAAIVVKQKPGVVFLIIGEGRDLPKLKERVKELGIAGNFEFIDWVDHKDIPKYLGKARMGLVTHLKTPATDIALVLKGLEYMAMGLPVVAPDLRGMREEVGYDERGLIFKAGSHEDLAEKIMRLLDNPRLRAEMGERGRKYILKNFDWDKNSQGIVEVCEKCV
jgi:glycosyltransferase involved in cell wall biosynthesis